MRKLALDDEILLSIEKPARYIGNEVNSIMKNKNEVDIRFAMCFPDVYEIGMSHLGIQILYDMFNRRDDVWCERVYSPWTDLDTIMRKEGIPLFALESQDPIREFDFLGITIQFEMCYTNILQILELSQIPLHSCDRAENDPIVIGGGPCVYNPEPLAEFFDLFYIGEGETVYDELLDTYKTCVTQSGIAGQDYLLDIVEFTRAFLSGDLKKALKMYDRKFSRLDHDARFDVTLQLNGMLIRKGDAKMCERGLELIERTMKDCGWSEDNPLFAAVVSGLKDKFKDNSNNCFVMHSNSFRLECVF